MVKLGVSFQICSNISWIIKLLFHSTIMIKFIIIKLQFLWSILSKNINLLVLFSKIMEKLNSVLIRMNLYWAYLPETNESLKYCWLKNTAGYCVMIKFDGFSLQFNQSCVM